MVEMHLLLHNNKQVYSFCFIHKIMKTQKCRRCINNYSAIRSALGFANYLSSAILVTAT